ncbi:MAG TPA: trypsin-like peptidase domain-containing protein [Gaiellaceae bacterium]|nr:trypsin-like peptidase domain-containing protein [Gaiellaceae bacterium]
MTAIDTASAIISDRELRVCTVRIDIGGAPKGSGFFVAPGHVVTCAHVLGEARENIAVSDVSNVAYTVAKVADVWPEDDLAVLRVTPASEHKCVLLIGGQRFDDKFVTFGYPELRREGVASPLRAEGNTGDERLLRLGGGQVQPGISGAPLLNRRTGGVCGVLSLTRDERTDLGGYAIPIERLWLLSPTLKSQNQKYHEARRHEWFDLLPTQQKTVLLQASARSASEGFTTWFVVSIGGERRHWRVSATLYPTEEHLPDEPAEVHLVLDQVARLFRDWATPARDDPMAPILRRFNHGEAIRLLGAILFDAVLPDEIGKRFDELLSTGAERLQLALHFDRTVIPTEFVDMPWEYLYMGGPEFRADAQLAAQQRLAFVRVQHSEHQPPAPPTRRQLSALMIPVTPPAQGGDSASDAIVEHAGEVVERLEGVDAETLPMPTAMALRDKLESGVYDIVHYVGFGRYYEGADRLALGGTPDFDFREAQMFAALFPEGEQQPRIVVLQQIKGPSDYVPPDLSVFAWRLLERGVEAVVAYEFPLGRRLSKAFNKELYTRLAAGESFEATIQRARALIWTMEPDVHAFLSPAAFVTRPGELRLTTAAAPSAPLARVGATSSNA